jgi:hypothetical protein
MWTIWYVYCAATRPVVSRTVTQRDRRTSRFGQGAVSRFSFVCTVNLLDFRSGIGKAAESNDGVPSTASLLRQRARPFGCLSSDDMSLRCPEDKDSCNNSLHGAIRRISVSLLVHKTSLCIEYRPELSIRRINVTDFSISSCLILHKNQQLLYELCRHWTNAGSPAWTQSQYPGTLTILPEKLNRWREGLMAEAICNMQTGPEAHQAPYPASAEAKKGGIITPLPDKSLWKDA